MRPRWAGDWAGQMQDPTSRACPTPSRGRLYEEPAALLAGERPRPPAGNNVLFETTKTTAWPNRSQEEGHEGKATSRTSLRAQRSNLHRPAGRKQIVALTPLRTRTSGLSPQIAKYFCLQITYQTLLFTAAYIEGERVWPAGIVTTAFIPATTRSYGCAAWPWASRCCRVAPITRAGPAGCTTSPASPAATTAPAPPPRPATVRMIPLGDGCYAYVDAGDYEWLSRGIGFITTATPYERRRTSTSTCIARSCNRRREW